MTASSRTRSRAMIARSTQLRVNRLLLRAGVAVTPVKRNADGETVYRRNREVFVGQLAGTDDAFSMGTDFPCYFDRTDQAGTATGHYFHQDLFVAQQIHAGAPRRHLDMGSRVDGFVAHVAAFRHIEVLDIRPLDTVIENISFSQFDLMRDVGGRAASTDSLSCLHALEHIGLGRYGDDVNADGWRIGLTHLIDMVEPGGTLYLSVPIGPQRVEFDAHRVFAVPFMRDQLSERCDLTRFAYVDDAGNLHVDPDLSSDAAQRSFDCVYGCGIFVARRRA